MYFSNHNPLPDRDLVELQWLEVGIPFLSRQVGRRSDLIFYSFPPISPYLPTFTHSFLQVCAIFMNYNSLPERDRRCTLWVQGRSSYLLRRGKVEGLTNNSTLPFSPTSPSYLSNHNPLPERDLVELQWLGVGIPFLSRQVGRRSDMIFPYLSFYSYTPPYFSNHNPLPERDLVELQWLEVGIPFLSRQVGRRSDIPPLLFPLSHRPSLHKYIVTI